MSMDLKSLVNKITNCLLNVFIVVFGIILLISLYTTVQTRLMGRDYADFFGYSIFEVQTGSMADSINPGDWILVRTSSNIKLKDVVTYKKDGEFITHRVVEVYKNTYVTKGDANNAKDEPIEKSKIVGRVVKVLAGFGFFRKTLFNPTVLVALIITFFLISLYFKKSSKEVKVKNMNVVKIKKEIIKFIEYLKNVLKNILNKKSKKKNIENKEVEDVNIEQVVFSNSQACNAKKYDFSDIDEDDENDELSKTSIFKLIPVDESELDDTFLEIANNEMILSENDNSINKENIVKEDENIDNSLTKINLDLLYDDNYKKGKNLIDRVIIVKIEEIEEIISLIILDKLAVNESTIKKEFIGTYIDGKYYNYYGNIGEEFNSKKQSVKIEKALNLKCEQLIKYYKGSDDKYQLKARKFLKLFKLILSLDSAKDSINDNKAKEEFYKKELQKFYDTKKLDIKEMKTIIEEIIKVQRNYIGILDYVLKKLETNMFKLNLNRLVTHKDMYGVELEHNISFSKIYSDYIIDKTYNEGIIAEDKVPVLLTLLSTELINNMLNGIFNKKYIIYIEASLYSKEKKLNRLLKMVDDEYVKESVIILVSYEEFISNRVQLKKLKKQGYRFSIIFNDVVKLDQRYKNDLVIMDYIFVNKKVIDVVSLLAYIPEELLGRIVYEDISSKIGDFGGED